MKKAWMTVISQKEIARNIYEMTLEGELVEMMSSPGQFVHIRVTEGFDTLLRRPISISSIDTKKGRFRITYRADGKGTKLLATKQSGEKIDVLGPLGNGFPIAQLNSRDHALIVGGGIGVPPLLELTKQLNQTGVRTTHILGFQSKEDVFYKNEFSYFGDTYVATVDGSYGTKGFVTTILDEITPSFTTLFACGPTPMLKALENMYPNENVYLSLEERMGCGIGACFACVCHLQDDPQGYTYKKVCTDGPVFKAREVVL
ncbi:dihydroorotate dehydrogenase electron transfer subunit [Sutcliffiella rhizosphaerae]|uniref:Dihydroorotate dehydrogenase B (NAD(+)), electron transfer subunit n=1 Tax=Sutcliffiella rhizosphaerae TaxID=2880967 RepID=A0ABN8A7N8_9BACI|nr:dihydroorotate dehydrogenase electron transfer subunit [Sutcliffiella rhizosphaerae]CAG9619776.1 Dihydroorotate dehydrogenase B (NAD(+)), electron transfer subunit [Sutcliffiella rhizosphaerae]